jgi:mycofactocin system transcriptional regulator
MTEPLTGARTGGRQLSTSRARISHVALELFLENGFDGTTVDDIARAAGIGRRTFFRYFPSKNDVAWGDFESLLEVLEYRLDNTPPEDGILDALTAAVLEFNAIPAEETALHRQRMNLLLTVPSLAAHSALRYVTWRRIIASFVAQRLGAPADDARPQTIAYALLGVVLASYERWLADPDADLAELLTEGMGLLRFGVQESELRS